MRDVELVHGHGVVAYAVRQELLCVNAEQLSR